jgi:hypothetical protein
MTKLTNAAALRSARWKGRQQGFSYSLGSVHLSHTERHLSLSHFLDNALHFLDNASHFLEDHQSLLLIVDISHNQMR